MDSHQPDRGRLHLEGPSLSIGQGGISELERAVANRSHLGYGPLRHEYHRRRGSRVGSISRRHWNLVHRQLQHGAGIQRHGSADGEHHLAALLGGAFRHSQLSGTSRR